MQHESSVDLEMALVQNDISDQFRCVGFWGVFAIQQAPQYAVCQLGQSRSATTYRIPASLVCLALAASFLISLPAIVSAAQVREGH